MKRKCAFSLIEMLLVISVLLFLLAILLPVMRSVLSKSQSLKCATQLHHQLSGVIAYTEDHHHVFPDRQVPGVPVAPWIHLSSAYVCENSVDSMWLSANLEQSKRIYFCPSREKILNEVPFPFSWAYGSYAMNLRLMPVKGKEILSTAYNAYQRGALARITQVVNPTEILMITDSAPHGSTYPFYIWRSGSRRHQGGGNVGYVDGHVSWVDHPVFNQSQNFGGQAYTYWRLFDPKPWNLP